MKFTGYYYIILLILLRDNFLQSDGAYLQITSAQPIHYKAGDTYKEIDNRLETVTQGDQTTCNGYCSLNTSYASTGTPYIVTEYSALTGDHSDYSCHTVSAGRAGTVTVNDFTGRMQFEAEDLSIPGNREGNIRGRCLYVLTLYSLNLPLRQAGGKGQGNMATGSVSQNFAFSPEKHGDFFIGTRKVLTNLFGTRVVSAYVTTPEIEKRKKLPSFFEHHWGAGNF